MFIDSVEQTGSPGSAIAGKVSFPFMRTLRLTMPRMTGDDVKVWQRFLKARGLLTGPADGIFGPKTAQATREYQRSIGLDVDGVAGPNTFHRAVQDGFQPPAGAVRLGMDTNAGCAAHAACIVVAGKRFVARYYSKFAAKTLRLAEARTLSGAGLDLVVVYQDRNNAIGEFSEAQGHDTATRALTQAGAMGQPSGSAIYFAADFDPSAAEIRGSISEYFNAVNNVFSTAATGYRIGAYGSGLTCRIVRNAGLASLTWLSGSTGFRGSTQFRPEANILQILPERRICGGALEIDDDVAQTADIGAFRIS